MTSINLGVVGLGRMGRIFCKHIARQMDNARLAAISSRTPEVAAEIARLNHGMKIYPNYRDLMADPAIDGVLVATLTHTHHDIVIAAAEAGKARVGRACGRGSSSIRCLFSFCYWFRRWFCRWF